MSTCIHHGDAVRHGHRLDLVVRHVDEGRAEALVQLGELGAHVDAQLRVEVRQRLVHEEHVRMPDHGAAERDALALAAGELGGRRSSSAPSWSCCATASTSLSMPRMTSRRRAGQEPDQRQALMQAKPRHDERQAEVGPHRHVRVERVALEHHRDPPLVRPQMVDRRSADQNRAGILALDAGDDADQGRLPAARRADEGHELAVRDGKVDAAEHGRRAERLCDGSEARRPPRFAPAAAISGRLARRIDFVDDVVDAVGHQPLDVLDLDLHLASRRSGRRRRRAGSRPASAAAVAGPHDEARGRRPDDSASHPEATVVRPMDMAARDERDADTPR